MVFSSFPTRSPFIMSASSGSEINSFYKDRSVFVTGGTGFMGKVLIEKLLYSCSDIKEIFILMRPKKGRVPESRIEDMFKLPVSEIDQEYLQRRKLN